jgi:hypothetical protein
MKNSMHIAMELESMLPQNEKPEYTDGMRFLSSYKFNGNVDQRRKLITLP